MVSQYLTAFGGPILLGLFVCFFMLETWRSLRRRILPRIRRVATNLGLAAIAIPCIRLAVVPVAVLVAQWGSQHKVGIALHLPSPPWLQAGVAFVLPDYSMYWWHRLNHEIPFLWRFHNVHHTDLDLDVSTAMRFHFGELLLSVGARSVQVLLSGAGPATTLVYEIALEAETQFHHSNLRLPDRFERWLRMLVVTPHAWDSS